MLDHRVATGSMAKDLMNDLVITDVRRVSNASNVLSEKPMSLN